MSDATQAKPTAMSIGVTAQYAEMFRDLTHKLRRALLEIDNFSAPNPRYDEQQRHICEALAHVAELDELAVHMELEAEEDDRGLADEEQEEPEPELLQ